jgi:hypothetical protein
VVDHQEGGDDDLARVQQLATLQFETWEISRITGASMRALDDPSEPLGAAVVRGRMEADVLTRTAILKGVREGLPWAVELFRALQSARK